jgi:hypothetical protein
MSNERDDRPIMDRRTMGKLQTKRRKAEQSAIKKALPELRDEHYAGVMLHHGNRVMLALYYENERRTFEYMDGSELAEIRFLLTTGENVGSGLWTRYLQYCSLPERTARHRIQVAEGRYVRPRGTTVVPLPEPEPEPEPEPTPEPEPSEPLSAMYRRDKHGGIVYLTKAEEEEWTRNQQARREAEGPELKLQGLEIHLGEGHRGLFHYHLPDADEVRWTSPEQRERYRAVVANLRRLADELERIYALDADSVPEESSSRAT